VETGAAWSHGRWGAAAPDNLRRKPKLTPHQQREAIKRRDADRETLRSIARSYNVSAQTISRLGPAPGGA
jgi:hypothetical protein